MGDVISFPIAPSSGKLGVISMVGPDPKGRNTEERPGGVRRNAELPLIDKAIENVRTFKSPESVIAAARNLTQMLQQVNVRDITKTQVAKLVWPNDETPLKRFHKLTLPSLEISEERVARLQRRTKPYRKVAEALAKFMPDCWTREAALVRVFRNTDVDDKLQQLVADRQIRITEPDSCWRELTTALNSLASLIIRESGLDAHIKLIATTSGRYELAKETIVAAHHQWLLAHGPLADNFESCEEFPPIPSVPLFDELLTSPFPYMLNLTPTGSEQSINSLQVVVKVWRQLRLAVGPVDSIDQAGALFEVRTFVELEAEGKAIELLTPWLYLHLSEDVPIQIDGQDFVGTIDLGEKTPDGRLWLDLLMWNLQPEHYCAAWRRVTPELCADLLSRLPREQNLAGEIREYFPPANEPTLAPERTLGAALETALRVTNGPCLTSALLEEANRLVSLVSHEVERRRVEALELNDRAASYRSRQRE